MSANAKQISDLSLRGELTIRTIADVHHQIHAALADTRALVIDLAAAEETDLTLVQLLLSARISAERDGKTVTLAQPLPEAFAHELTRGGFFPSDNFWTQAGNTP
jgi:ABC-type transporter Mla MlaB component